MQSFPVTSMLDLKQISGTEVDQAPTSRDEVPLIEALLHCDDDDEEMQDVSDSVDVKVRHTGPAPLKIQAYINRVLKTASASQVKAGVTSDLSSHSFRRGGAQHANADATLSAQWIFDRGSWNMTSTNKLLSMCSTRQTKT